MTTVQTDGDRLSRANGCDRSLERPHSACRGREAQLTTYSPVRSLYVQSDWLNRGSSAACCPARHSSTASPRISGTSPASSPSGRRRRRPGQRVDGRRSTSRAPVVAAVGRPAVHTMAAVEVLLRRTRQGLTAFWHKPFSSSVLRRMHTSVVTLGRCNRHTESPRKPRQVQAQLSPSGRIRPPSAADPTRLAAQSLCRPKGPPSFRPVA